MLYIIIILAILISSAISVQDFRDREVSLLLLVVLSFAMVLQAICFVPLEQYFMYVLINTLFIFFLLLILSALFSLKEKRMVNITQKWIGSGDVVFLFILAIGLAPLTFLTFYIVSVLIAVLLGVLIWNKPGKTIPLAGLQSLCLNVLLLISVFKEAPGEILTNDEQLLSFFL